MTEYTYIREKLASGLWDIDNPERLDEGTQIHLAKEVETVLSMACQVSCNNGECKIIFAEELTAEEKTTLDTTVSNHKNNT